jgi:hypothetical protein
MNMSLESLIILLIVAAVVGTFAQLLSGYSREGQATASDQTLIFIIQKPSVSFAKTAWG